MKTPLITIIVASYNAENYICETLESCINQDYNKIEIIIVDDCSTDNSVKLINQWCEEKKTTHPDISCTLVTSEKNGGIPANLNKSLPVIKGSWIKCIGSDDILLPHAISEFILRLQEYEDLNNVGAIFTYFKTFGNYVKTPSQYPLAWTRDVCKMKSSWVKRKLSMLHFNNVAPCAFINKNHFTGFDTSFRLLEDLPLWLSMINRNVDTLFFEFTSVLYRLHDSQITSITNTKVNDILINDLKSLNKFRLKNGHFIAYVHHKFNLYCSLQRKPVFKWLKAIDPANLIIRLYERLR
ncbi:glycosyltransferase [Enterobacter ludwigii]